TGLKPLHAELLRPQQAFNLALVEAFAQIFSASPSREPALSGWAVRSLEPLTDPTAWQLSTTMGGPAGLAEIELKRRWVRGVSPHLGAFFDRQRRWNELAISAAKLASEGSAHLERAHHLIGAMKQQTCTVTTGA